MVPSRTDQTRVASSCAVDPASDVCIWLVPERGVDASGTRVWAYVPGGAGRVVSDSQGELSPNPPDGSACPEVMARIPRRGFPAGGPDRVRSCSIHVFPVSGFLRGASESELLSCLGLLPPVPSPPSSSSHSSVSVSIPARRSSFGFGPGCGSVLSRASLRPPDQAFPGLGLA